MLQTAQAALFYLSVLLVLHDEAHNGWKKFGTIFQGPLEFLLSKHWKKEKHNCKIQYKSTEKNRYNSIIQKIWFHINCFKFGIILQILKTVSQI